MSQEHPHPWWASGPEVHHLDTEEDPIERSRAARRPEGADRGAVPPEEAVDGEEAVGPTDAAGAEEAVGPEDAVGAGHHDASCSACPLCAGWRLLSEHHPEVAEHLSAAGRHLADARPEVAEHLTAAGRHLVAALREALEETDAAARPDADAPFERINLDVEDDPEAPR